MDYTLRSMGDPLLILLGRMWPELIAWARKSMLREDLGLVSPPDLDIPQCASDVDGAVALLRASRDRWLRAQEPDR